MAQKRNLNAAMHQLEQALRDLEQARAMPEPEIAPASRSEQEAAPITASDPVPVERRAAAPEEAALMAASDPVPVERRAAPPEDAAPVTDRAPVPAVLPPDQPSYERRTGPQAQGPAPSEALVRLVVGAALLGLDGLQARAGSWEAQAGLAARPVIPREVADQGGAFRHALVGWLFEAERELRPRGSPIRWLRAVVRYLFGTIFSVILELLPLPRPGGRRGHPPAEPSDEDTRRWVTLGLAEAEPSRRYAKVALEEIVDQAIIYLARRPAVQQALGEIVRSPAMDDAVTQIVNGPVIEQATQRVATSPALDTVIAQVGASPALEATVAKVAQSPAIEDAVRHVARSPAMQDAVRHLAESPAMNDAIDTLAQSPSLVALVTTQGTTVVGEFLREVRERAVSADKFAEGVVRKALRRPPRTALSIESVTLLLLDVERPDDGGRP
ncbi:MAG: hypothetical protein AB4911_01590 [Oscillochloridaceae bacterium umkhey_bin13]